MKKRKPAEEIIAPGESQNLLGWDRGRPSQRMLHHRPPRDPPKELPSAILLQLEKTLTDAMLLCQCGDINRLVAARMLEALAPIVRREQAYLRRKAQEWRFTEGDCQLASRIERLLLLGGAGEYTRLEISNHLSRNKTSHEISLALSFLRITGRAVTRRKVRYNGHKSAELWRLVRPDDDVRRYPLPPAPPPKTIPSTPRPRPGHWE